MPATVIAFKNGHAFVSQPFRRAPTISGGRAELSIPVVGEPLHGTFWAEVAGRQIISYNASAPTPEARTPLGQLIAANTGAAVTIGTQMAHQEKPNILEGTLVKVHPAESPEVAVVRTSQGDSAVLISDVRHFAVTSGDMKFGRTERQVTLVVAETKADVEGAEAEGTLKYLTKGLNWAPSYKLELDRESKTVQLTGQAALMCDLQSIQAGDPFQVDKVRFVAGFPSFTMLNVPDAALASPSIQQFFSQLAGDQLPGGFHHVERRRAPQMHMMQQQIAPQMMTNVVHHHQQMAYGSDDGDAVVGDDSQQHEDLYIYAPIQDSSIALRNGSRHVTTFCQSPATDFQDVHKIDIPLMSSGARSSSGKMRSLAVSYGGGGSSDTNTEGDVPVVHALRFRNKTRSTLTLAPVLVCTKDTVVAQGTLKTTPSEASCCIDLTRAMDVTAAIQTTSIGAPQTITIQDSWLRSGKKFIVYKYQVDVMIRNRSDKPVLAVVKGTVQGKLVDKSQDESEVQHREGASYYSPNDTSDYTWELNIVPERQARTQRDTPSLRIVYEHREHA
eukprot:Hpha_TRINITY_DN14231_c0_g1::TRINITY_DN14231_c0_g1_i2::g.22484::m.22484